MLSAELASLAEATQLPRPPRKTKHLPGVGNLPLPPLPSPCGLRKAPYAAQHLLVGKQHGFQATPPTPVFGGRATYVDGPAAFMEGGLKAPDSENPEYLAQLQQIIAMEPSGAVESSTISEHSWELRMKPCLTKVHLKKRMHRASGNGPLTGTKSSRLDSDTSVVRAIVTPEWGGSQSTSQHPTLHNPRRNSPSKVSLDRIEHAGGDGGVTGDFSSTLRGSRADSAPPCT